MSIQSISSGIQAASLQKTSAVKAACAQGDSTAPVNRSSDNTTDQAKFSDFGKLMAKLQDLSVNDPEKFKKVTSEIAEKLKDAAGSATGQDKEFLEKMAENFTKASESGNVDDIMPQQLSQSKNQAATYGKESSGRNSFGPPQGPPPTQSEAISGAMKEEFKLVEDE